MAQIIDKLHELVTPSVLSQTAELVGSDTDKKGVLGTIYALLIARLSDSDTVKHLESLPSGELDNGHELAGLLFGGIGESDAVANSKNVTGLMSVLADKFNLESNTVTGLTNTALPLAYAQLKNLSGTTPLATYLQDERASVLAGLPAWLTALVPAGLLGVFGLPSVSTAATPATATTTTAPVAEPVHVAAPTTEGTLTKTEKEEGSFMKALLPIIGLLILGGLAMLMMRGCQKEPTPVAAPVTAPAADTTAAALVPATFNLALDSEGKNAISCDAVVGNQGILDNIKSAVASVFGNADKCTTTLNADANAELAAGEYLPRILGFMAGVPDASVAISDKVIRFNAATPEAIEKLISDTKAIVPADFTVEAEPAIDVASAVSSSLEAANKAIDSLTADSSLDELVRALNLQIINFAVDSSEIPAENKAILDKAVDKLNAIPDARLKIIGHTDSTGDYAHNQKLSESRAKAVHDYLVSKGVSDDRLDILGASSDQPVASNATDQGRFRNRRIEFTVMKDGEQVAAIGNAPNSEATAVENAQEAAGMVTDAAKDAGTAVGDAAKATGEAVSNAVDSAATGVANAADAVKEKVASDNK